MAISGENHREPRNAIQIVLEALVFELITFIEIHEVQRPLIVAESIEQHVFRRTLSVDVDDPPDPIEKCVQGFEPTVVFPSVDVFEIAFNDVLTELFDGELGIQVFPTPYGRYMKAGSAGCPSRLGRRTLERFAIHLLNAPRIDSLRCDF